MSKTKIPQITKEFASFLNLRGLPLLVEIIRRSKTFILYLFINKKFEEFLSFLVWEIVHFLKINRKNVIHLMNISSLKYSDEEMLDRDKFNWKIEGGTCELLPVSWTLVYIVSNEEMLGVANNRLNVLVRSNNEGTTYTDVFTFSSCIDAIYVSHNYNIYVCSDGNVYKSKDNGATFNVVLQLSTPHSVFIHNYGITEDDKGTIFLGEYANVWVEKKGWKNVAYIYYCPNNSENFTRSDFFIKEGANKHIHMIRYCSYLKKLFVTDGDNKKRVWINDSMQNYSVRSSANQRGWRLINKRHIDTGGYTSVVSLTDGVLFGSDYLGGTNFIIKTVDGIKMSKKTLPDPIRRNPIYSIVNVKSRNRNQVWVNSVNDLGRQDAKAVLFYSNDNGETWFNFIEYDGLKCKIEIRSASLNPTNYFLASICNKENNRIIGTFKIKLD
ncbi:hypothetical protein GCM10008018_65770 [Paenibacillus marchantiophytorum]|uniref:Exo-alpha-sialidase n=1 Tax=Paenibacillus marchantiophytorum TaxID=1619310 RepID=A0ABQ1FGC8_9BACL|nr:hypothetical protein [Paenibacillus marchantiophytorum]GGA11511.1 hypothetical protein GCM10008018_65770 [Paenibacillus marchantiophytorum]